MEVRGQCGHSCQPYGEQVLGGHINAVPSFPSNLNSLDGGIHDGTAGSVVGNKVVGHEDGVVRVKVLKLGLRFGFSPQIEF